MILHAWEYYCDRQQTSGKYAAHCTSIQTFLLIETLQRSTAVRLATIGEMQHKHSPGMDKWVSHMCVKELIKCQKRDVIPQNTSLRSVMYHSLLLT